MLRFPFHFTVPGSILMGFLLFLPFRHFQSFRFFSLINIATKMHLKAFIMGIICVGYSVHNEMKNCRCLRLIVASSLQFVWRFSGSSVAADNLSGERNTFNVSFYVVMRITPVCFRFQEVVTRLIDKEKQILSSDMSASSVHQKPNDDAFYENLTLGLIKVLSNIPRITNINYDKRNPAERNSVTAWESRHNVNLPADMKAFYLCTDGFCLFWSYEYSANDIKRVGKIHIPHLIQITLMRENLESIMATPGNQPQTKPSTSSSIVIDAIPMLSLTTKSKIFELSTILEVAKVVMLYETPESCPKIYLLELETLKLQFLADTFSEYLRMAIAHLGLPYWELCFSSCCPLPTWTQVSSLSVIDWCWITESISIFIFCSNYFYCWLHIYSRIMSRVEIRETFTMELTRIRLLTFWIHRSSGTSRDRRRLRRIDRF